MIVAGSIVKRCLGVKKKEPQYIVVSGIQTPIFGIVIVHFPKSNLEQIRVQRYVLEKKKRKIQATP